MYNPVPPRAPFRSHSNSSSSANSTSSFSDSDDVDIESTHNLLAEHEPKRPPYGKGSFWRRKWPSIKPKVRLLLIVLGIAGGVLTLYSATSRLATTSVSKWQNEIQTQIGKWKGSPREWYPTDFTRDIFPKHIHSHNDYWRDVPLYTGLSYGCISTEADVWLFDNELFVGHTRASLAKNRTLTSLYLEPLQKILAMQNPRNEFTKNDTVNGVFDVEPNQTVFLYIDVKTDPIPTYNKILQQLEPLRTPINYLTTFETDKVIYRPVTVILTGDAPFDEMMSNKTYRYYFYDAPINDLSSGKYDKFTSVTATGNFKSQVGGNGIPFLQSGALSDMEKARMKNQVNEAHGLGLFVRYWNLPNWPVSWRNSIWHEVVKGGVDLLSVDDVKAASSYNW